MFPVPFTRKTFCCSFSCLARFHWKANKKIWQKISQPCRCFHYWIPEIMIENCSILFSLSGPHHEHVHNCYDAFFSVQLCLRCHRTCGGESLHSVTTPDCYFFRFSWNFQSLAVQTEAKATGLQSVNLELEKREKQSEKKKKISQKIPLWIRRHGHAVFRKKTTLEHFVLTLRSWQLARLTFMNLRKFTNIAFCRRLSDRQIILAKYFFNEKVFEIIQKLQNVSSSMNP